MSDFKATAIGSDTDVQENIRRQNVTDSLLTQNEVKHHAGSSNNCDKPGEQAGEQSSGAQNEAWTRDMPIRNTHTTPMTSDSTPSTNIPAARAFTRRLRRQYNQDKTAFVCSYYEQRLRDEYMKGALEGAVAAYLDASKADSVPEHIMEGFREQARAQREEPLGPEAEEFLAGLKVEDDK